MCGKGLMVGYWTRNFQVAVRISPDPGSFASNPEQVANQLCAQVNSASCPQRDGK